MGQRPSPQSATHPSRDGEIPTRAGITAPPPNMATVYVALSRVLILASSA